MRQALLRGSQVRALAAVPPPRNTPTPPLYELPAIPTKPPLYPGFCTRSLYPVWYGFCLCAVCVGNLSGGNTFTDESSGDCIPGAIKRGQEQHAQHPLRGAGGKGVQDSGAHSQDQHIQGWCQEILSKQCGRNGMMPTTSVGTHKTTSFPLRVAVIST